MTEYNIRDLDLFIVRVLHDFGSGLEVCYLSGHQSVTPCLAHASRWENRIYADLAARDVPGSEITTIREVMNRR